MDEYQTMVIADESTGDNDKAFQVPLGATWHIYNLYAQYTIASSCSTGTRQLRVNILDDAADVIAEYRAGATQEVNTVRYYTFAPGLADMDSFRDTDFLTTPIPGTLVLPTGYSVRIYDQADIASSGGQDDMDVQLLVGRKSTLHKRQSTAMDSTP